MRRERNPLILKEFISNVANAILRVMWGILHAFLHIAVAELGDKFLKRTRKCI